MPLPAELKRSYWDDNKGRIAKALGKTGVGDAMKNASDSFAKVDEEVFKTKLNANDPENCRVMIPRIEAEITKIRQSADMYQRLHLAAKAAHGKLGGSKLKLLVKQEDINRAKVIADAAEEHSKYCLSTARQAENTTKVINETLKQHADDYKSTLAGQLDKALKSLMSFASPDLAAFASKFNAGVEKGVRGAYIQLSKAASSGQTAINAQKGLKAAEGLRLWADGFKGKVTANDVKAEFAKVRAALEKGVKLLD